MLSMLLIILLAGVIVIGLQSETGRDVVRRGVPWAAVALGILGIIVLSTSVWVVRGARQIEQRHSGFDLQDWHSRPVPATPRIPDPPAPPTALPDVETDPLPPDTQNVDVADEIPIQQTAVTLPLKVTLFDFHKQRESTSALPDWADQVPVVDRDGERLELKLVSERFATLEEAREQLWQQLSRKLTRILSERYGADLPRQSLTLADIEAIGVLQQEYRVSWPLQVGDFTETVHQIYWDVELTDARERKLFALVKPIASRGRLLAVATGFGGITLLCGAGAFALRKRS